MYPQEKNDFKKLNGQKYAYSGKNLLYRLGKWFGLTVLAFVFDYLFPQDVQLNYCIAAEALAAIIAAAGSAASTGISSAVSGKMNRRALRYNKEQAELNRQFQAEQTHEARDWQERFYNLYSSPAAQVRQYQEAGLNPALMYQSGVSGGSVPSTVAASGTQASAPSQIMPDFSGIMDAVSMMLNYDLQSKLIDAQVGNLNANTSKVAQETENLKTNQELMNADIYLKHVTADNVLVQTELHKSEIKRIDSEIRNIDFDTLVKDASLGKILSEIDLNYSEMELITARVGLTYKQYEQVEAYIDNLLADTKNKDVERSLLNAKIVTEQAMASLTEEKAHNTSVERVGISRDNYLKIIDMQQATVTGTTNPSQLTKDSYAIYAAICGKFFNGDRVGNRPFYDFDSEKEPYKGPLRDNNK